MTWHEVFPSDAIADGAAVGVTIDGRAIMVARVDGVARASTDVCPHAGGALSGGVIRHGCVTCPAHLWRFNLTTGYKQGDDRVRIAVYPSREVDGVIEVDLPNPPVVRTLREVLLAHARGEVLDLAPDNQEW